VPPATMEAAIEVPADKSGVAPIFGRRARKERVAASSRAQSVRRIGRLGEPRTRSRAAQAMTPPHQDT
jgi:hypothetical protein